MGLLPTEIAVLRTKYEEQANSDAPSPSLQFEFACLLVCSPRKADMREGVRLLEELLGVGFDRIAVLNNLTLTYLKLGQYVRAKENVDLLLQLQPKSGMARLLHSLVLDRASHDGLLGLLCMGLFGAGLAVMVMR